MAKSNNGESKATRAPVRRRVVKGSANGLAHAPEMAVVGSAGGPNPDEVQRLAYELFLKRGGTDGRDKDDWFEAERQLRSRLTH
jgi:hypothetical protein